jgi:hypothetical protein
MKLTEELRAKTANKKKPSKNKSDNDATPTAPQITEAQSPNVDKPTHKGKLILDSTCVPQKVKYPVDITILDDVRRWQEKLIDTLHTPKHGKKPRTHRRKARSAYLKIIRNRKRSKEQIRDAIGIQLNYIENNFKIIDKYFKKGLVLSEKHSQTFSVITAIYQQQLQKFSYPDQKIKARILSISQPHLRSIYRGKPGAQFEIGAQIDVSVIDSFGRLERLSFDPYHEGENLISAILKYYTTYGYYPEEVMVDHLYRTKENIKFCNDLNIKIIGAPLGKTKEAHNQDKKQVKRSEIERIEVERKFSLLKCKYGLKQLATKTAHTTQTAISLAIITMNIGQILRLIKKINLHLISLLYIAQRYCHINLIKAIYEPLFENFEQDALKTRC